MLNVVTHRRSRGHVRGLGALRRAVRTLQRERVRLHCYREKWENMLAVNKGL